MRNVLKVFVTGLFTLGLLTSCASGVSHKDPNEQIASVLSQLEAQYETVTETRVYTEDTDPNKTLGKPGSYVAAGAFKDSRVTETVVEDNWATDAGGSIEIFASNEEAEKRYKLLQSFNGTFLASGSELVGNVVIRTSNGLTASQQKELTEFLKENL